MHTERSQRWRQRRALYVPTASLINPRLYAVDQIEAAAARRFINDHHYLENFPASHFCVGLFGPGPGGTTELAGVAVFATPCNDSVITAHTGLASARHGSLLARFALLDHVPGNGESMTLSGALKLLKRARPEIAAVVSYSDPLRFHVGEVYKGCSAAYRGRTKPRTEHLIGGRTINSRTLSKVRTGERGADGAIAQIIRSGAPRPRPTESQTDWLDRLRRERILTRRTHPGLFAYCFEISRRSRQLGRTLPRLPYPTIVDLPQPALPFDVAA